MLQRARFVRRLTQRGTDWAALSAKITGDAARAELSRTRELMEELRQLNSGKTEVPAIDWDHYKSVIKTPGVVEEFQAAFAASSIAPMENTFSSEVASSKSEMTAAAEALVAESAARLEELEAEIAAVQDNMVDENTAIEDVWAENPGMKEEIEAEIEAHEWGKDVGSG